MPAKFPKLIDYQSIKNQYSEDAQQSTAAQLQKPPELADTDVLDENVTDTAAQKPQGMTGTRLRSYAFAVLTRREYSKKDLIEKLCLYAQSREEVLTLVEELSRENYQSDRRVAEMVVRSQVRQGKGPNRIKLALSAKSIESSLAKPEMEEIDWYAEAYALKVKKYGTEVATDPKLKAKQIRFLQYRGFDMDCIMKAIRKKAEDD